MIYKGCKLKKEWTKGATTKIEIWYEGLKIGQAPTWSKAQDKVDAYCSKPVTIS